MFLLMPTQIHDALFLLLLLMLMLQGMKQVIHLNHELLEEQSHLISFQFFHKSQVLDDQSMKNNLMVTMEQR